MPATRATPATPATPDSEPELASVRAAVAGWFVRGHRDLPWRRTRDPYAVWVSEIMLQQTRVETVAPRFSRWMARFPTASVLAEAPLDEVLAEWAGLGYYARARNLHAAARLVAREHGGELPSQPEQIARLPGIGRYTAGAVLSIAFDQPAAILDGNVERVLARIFRVGGDPRSAAVKKRLWSLAEGIVAAADAVGGERYRPSEVNQGLMELGAVLCSPRRPACMACPVESLCQARRAGQAEAYPEKARATAVLAVEQVALALVRSGKLLLMRRPPEGLWGGLYELPSGEPQVGESLPGAARRIAAERAGLDVPVHSIEPLPPPAGSFVHQLSHRRITLHGFRAPAPAARVRRAFYDHHQFVPLPAAAGLGISRATSRLIAALTDAQNGKRSRGHG